MEKITGLNNQQKNKVAKFQKSQKTLKYKKKSKKYAKKLKKNVVAKFKYYLPLGIKIVHAFLIYTIEN